MASPKPIVEGLWQLGLGPVNVFLLQDNDDLTVIDTGTPHCESKILAGIHAIGKRPHDVKNIVVTHCHPDHAGSVGSLKRMTRARVVMHPDDAWMVRKGESARPMTPSPGWRRQLLFKLFIPKKPIAIEQCVIDREVNDGDVLPIGGGLKVIHVPGQSKGQIALHWPRRRVLFAADACANMMGLGLSLGYENFDDAHASLRKLAGIDFDVAVFGHGGPIKRDAGKKFRELWAQA
jgi:glyoxylase-like metal-dependent hydrolase (beta-lactamase superfamily II)